MKNTINYYGNTTNCVEIQNRNTNKSKNKYTIDPKKFDVKIFVKSKFTIIYFSMLI